MKLYAPSYYKTFACIADKCMHSCCVGWEIDVDSETMKKYAALTDGYGKEIKKSIEKGEAPHFRLCAGERCPHLNEKGLCNIILALGEDYLCDICREHPRFYHDTAHGREVGLGMACEEACRIILTACDYKSFLPIGEVENDGEAPRFDATEPRDRMLALLADESCTYGERKRALCAAWDVSAELLSEEEIRTLLDSLEYLDPANKARLACYRAASDDPAALDGMLERALAYFIFRHVSPAFDEEEVRAALCFSLLCERLIASVAHAEGVEDLQGMIGIARTVSEEIEYSEENTEAIKTEFLFRI